MSAIGGPVLSPTLGISDGQFPENVGGVLTGVPVDNGLFQFRLTPTTGTPVLVADSAATTNLYLSPFKGNRMALYDGTRWRPVASAELTLALGTLVTYQAYDVFVDWNSGTPQLVKVEWANASVAFTSATPTVVTWNGHGMETNDSITFTAAVMPTGVNANQQYFIIKIDANTFNICLTRTNVAANTRVAASSTGTTVVGHNPQDRQTALTTQDGVLVLTGTTTYRYAGTFVATSTSQTQCSFGGTTTQVGGKWMVYSYYNPQIFKLTVFDSADSWSYALGGGAAWRCANATEANHVEIVCGQVLSACDVRVLGWAAGTSSDAGSIGAGIDTTNAIPSTGTNPPKLLLIEGTFASNWVIPFFALWNGRPVVGWHGIYWLEYTRAGTMLFLGDNGVVDAQTGMQVEFAA